ncbi:glycosyltransferase [Kluyvera sichuanensis]|uniref:glycosyltransferase n=1 Tax=Kluyvera sichuanensis TaxID=2725494 RepID=UPI0034A36DD3
MHKVEILNNSIAVIMSVYKNDDVEYLKLACDSMLSQTVSCDLYIYRDGLVKSELQSILDEYACLSNVTLVENDVNRGLAYGLNQLIEMCVKKDYSFVARMDSDDISFLNRLSLQVNYFSSHPDVDVCGGFCEEFGASYSLKEKRLPLDHKTLKKFSISRCPFIHPSVMFRMCVLKSGVRYPTNTYYCEDLALWFDLLKKGFKLGNVNKVLLSYRMTEDTLQRRRGIKKAYSEFTLRLYYMFTLKEVTIKNFFLIISRFFFHLTPIRLMKLAYKIMR